MTHMEDSNGRTPRKLFHAKLGMHIFWSLGLKLLTVRM